MVVLTIGWYIYIFSKRIRGEKENWFSCFYIKEKIDVIISGYNDTIGRVSSW